MKFLLFLLGITFFFIFFFLNTKNIDASFLPLFIEANIYIILSFIAIWYTVYLWKNQSSWEKKTLPSIWTKEECIHIVKQFFSSQIYYIALLFFYIAIFLIFQELFWSPYLPRIFVLLNIWVLFFYIFEQRFTFLYDIIRTNTILISWYYSIIHLSHFIWYSKTYTLEDIGNIILLFILFFLLLKNKLSQKYRKTIFSHAFIFFILEVAIIFDFTMWLFQFPMHICLFIFTLLFFLFPHIWEEKLCIPSSFFLTWGKLLSFLNISLSVSLLFWDFSLLLLLPFAILLFYSWAMYKYYLSFWEISTLLFSIFSYIWIFVWLYFHLFWEKIFLQSLWIIFLIFSLFPLFMFPFIWEKNIYSMYMLHIFSFGVNILWCIFFFLFQDFSLLYLGYIFAFESFYLLVVYYIFRKYRYIWKHSSPNILI